MAEDVVNGFEVQDMVAHWLRVPPNGYLGSGYGSDVHALLQKPRAATGLANALIAKMRTDVPILKAARRDAVAIFFEDRTDRKDAKNLLIQVSDSLIRVDPQGNVTT